MRKASSFILVVILLCSSLPSCEPWRDDSPCPRTTIELDSGWRFREAGGEGEWMPAAVPGCVHTDLLAAGAIPDPFFGDNEKDLQWVGKKDWVYECSFDAGSELLSHSFVYIEFDGLDTYAEVRLNGIYLLSADNMFRKWRSDIKPHLRRGTNVLEIRFRSPGSVEAKKSEALGYGLPGGGRVFTRKAAYHYGWDFGPRFVTCGIWKPVRITGWSGIILGDIGINIIALSEERAIVQFDVDADYETGANLILIDEDSGKRCSNFAKYETHTKRTHDLTRETFKLFIPEPRLWWPAGLGDQQLRRYTVEASLDGVVVDSASLSLALRTVELVTDRDEAGESFYIRVNGVPVFMKGANWIPLDVFLPRPGPDDYRKMLVAVKDANMNMLRVWGGGIYEKDIFYDLCDSLGILVWQDFMFACAMYPGDRDFLQNTKLEAEESIKRLKDHMCITLWCGNNEIEEGWRNWGWRDDYPEEKQEDIRRAYEGLFIEQLPRSVRYLERGDNPIPRKYIPSSPRFGRADPRSLTEGDSHYWGLWHDAEPFEVLEEKVPRFMSEFGFQSLPSMRTIGMFAGPDEFRLDSAAMLAHQKHSRGYGLIREYMERWYRVPEKFEDYVYVSQLLQAEGMRIGFEAQRRAMPYCMGSLYWQLNDCWPAVSWSSIDYAGEWKALHYAAKKAFEPVLVSTTVNGGNLDIYIVSDRLEELGGWVTMKLKRFDGGSLWEKTVSVKTSPNSSTKIFSVPLEDLLSGADRSAVVFSAEFDCPGERPPVAIRYFALPKEMKLPEAAVAVEAAPGGPATVLTLTSGVLAKNVFLQVAGGGHFSDNFFDILPGEAVTVTVDTDVPPDEIIDKIKIRTLRDTY